MGKLECKLNNVKTGYQLGILELENFIQDFTIRTSGSYLTGTIGNASIFDTTDYPLTLAKRDVAPFRIFSAMQPDANDLLKFSISIYNEPKDDIGTEIDVELAAM